MKEELYIKINGVREMVDISSPSGIIINFSSNLLKDISSIDCQKSFTFNIPVTSRNLSLFCDAIDMRYNANSVGKKYEAEFIIDGVQMSHNAYLYVQSYSDESLKACMTFNVLKHLLDIKDNAKKINTFEDKLIEIYPNTIRYAYKDSYKELRIGDDAYNGITNATDYTNIDIMFPKYECGVQNAYSRLGNEPKLMETDVQDFIEERGMRTWPAYIPVVPVNMILKEIETKYNCKFSFREDVLNADNDNEQPKSKLFKYGGIPLAKITIDKKWQEQNKVDATIIAEHLGDIAYQDLSVVNAEKYNIIDMGYIIMMKTPIGETYDWLDFFPQKINHEDTETRYVFQTKYPGEGVKLRGYLKLVYDTMLSEPPSISVVQVDYRGKKEVMAISAEKNEFESRDSDNQDVCEQIYEFNFDSSIGGEEQEIPTSLRPHMDTYFVLSKKPKMQWEGNLEIIPYFDNTIVSHPSSSIANLPDISCIDLIKNLFFLAGGFPKIVDENTIGITYFSDILDNLKIGNCYDWSKKRVSSKQDVTYGTNDIRRNNYYLMGNMDIKDKKDSNDDDDVREVYSEEGSIDIKCDTEHLEEKREVFKSVFYDKFIHDNNNFDLHTGNSYRYWEQKRHGPLSSVESPNPCIGIFNVDSGEKLTFDIATFADAKEQYDFLQSLYRKPYIIKDNMYLSIFELSDIDYAKPVYIEQYNSYFAIINIVYNTNSGISEAELIRIEY